MPIILQYKLLKREDFLLLNITDWIILDYWTLKDVTLDFSLFSDIL